MANDATQKSTAAPNAVPPRVMPWIFRSVSNQSANEMTVAFRYRSVDTTRDTTSRPNHSGLVNTCNLS